MRFVKEAGAEAVKVEGGERRLELIARLTEAEIPVMGHVGLTPQSVNALGGYRVQGKTPNTAEQLLRDARSVEAAGAFAIVLEAMPRELAAEITLAVRIPTIGIGSVARPAGINVSGRAEICATVRQCGRDHFERGEGILHGRAERQLSDGCGVLSRAE
jgi:3-methyl-2-oxobutanoate hydroxymethyltransferase